MKSIFFTLSAAFCCLISACNNENGSAENIATSRDIVKGIETGDSSKLTAIAPDAVDHAGPTGDVTGADSIKAMLLEIHNRIRDLKFEILGDAANGDYVYTWSRMTGTALDSSMGFPAGQPMSVKSVDIIRFNNGKAVEHWSNIDQQDMMLILASQAPNATTVKVMMGDTATAGQNDTTKRQ